MDPPFLYRLHLSWIRVRRYYQHVFCEKPAFSVVLFLPLKWLEMADLVAWFGWFCFFLNSWLFIIPFCSLFMGLFIFAFCLKERESCKQYGTGLASLQEQMELAAKNSKCGSRLELSHGPRNGDAPQLNLLGDLLSIVWVFSFKIVMFDEGGQIMRYLQFGLWKCHQDNRILMKWFLGFYDFRLLREISLKLLEMHIFLKIRKLKSW